MLYKLASDATSDDIASTVLVGWLTRHLFAHYVAAKVFFLKNNGV